MGLYWWGQMLLLAFLGCLYGSQWQAIKDAKLPMQASKYSFFKNSFFTKPDNKALIAVLLTL